MMAVQIFPDASAEMPKGNCNLAAVAGPQSLVLSDEPGNSAIKVSFFVGLLVTIRAREFPVSAT